MVVAWEGGGMRGVNLTPPTMLAPAPARLGVIVTHPTIGPQHADRQPLSGVSIVTWYNPVPLLIVGGSCTVYTHLSPDFHSTPPPSR